MAVSDHRDTDPGGTAPGGLAEVGRSIQERREALGLSAEQLAGTLHLGVEQLRSLELGDLQGLPEPVFIKAMVRRIAGHLRLDADALANQLGTISTPTRKPIITAAASMTASPERRRRGMLLPIVLLITAGGGGAMLLRTRLAMSPVQTPAESMEKPAAPTPQQPVTESKPVSAAPPEPLASSLTISSREPSWIALRRNGNLEFQGTLVEDRTVDDPDNVEIYAGRPDLVMVKRPGAEASALGAIDAVRWYRLSPEL